MEIKTVEQLESTGYRCLFECVKQEGIEPVLGLVQDINDLPGKEILIRQTIMEKRNDLARLTRKNKDVIRYLKEHKEEIRRLSLEKEDVLNILKSLYANSALLDVYLENARRLEALKVSDVKFVSAFDGDYHCGIYRDTDGNIINIKKYYTDGNIIAGEELLKDELFNYSIIPFCISNSTFLLTASNSENFHQYSGIQITDFAFDGSKLPTEEEIQKYEIPKTFIKN